jgi:hypothetical protein
LFCTNFFNFFNQIKYFNSFSKNLKEQNFLYVDAYDKDLLFDDKTSSVIIDLHDFVGFLPNIMKGISMEMISLE